MFIFLPLLILMVRKPDLRLKLTPFLALTLAALAFKLGSAWWPVGIVAGAFACYAFEEARTNA